MKSKHWQPELLEWVENKFLFNAVVVLGVGNVDAVLQVLKGSED